MADADSFTRPYLFVDVQQPARSEAVAQLLEAAASAVRSHGEVTVHHIAFETNDNSNGASVSLTLYYDRIERRQHGRD